MELERYVSLELEVYVFLHIQLFKFDVFILLCHAIFVGLIFCGVWIIPPRYDEDNVVRHPTFLEDRPGPSTFITHGFSSF